MALAALLGALGGCAYEPPRPHAPGPGVWAPSPSPVIYGDDDAPLEQPATVFIDAPPPPVPVEVLPPRPAFDAVWIGGHWGWRSRWVWYTGRWALPPRPGYVWTHPYYEDRGGIVVFVPGFWRGPHAVFAPPPPRLRMPVMSSRGGGARPGGPPPGVAVPRPPHGHPPRPQWGAMREPLHRPPRVETPAVPPDGAVVSPGQRPAPGTGWRTSPSGEAPSQGGPARDGAQRRDRARDGEGDRPRERRSSGWGAAKKRENGD